MTSPDDDRDAQLAEQLADYETQLASGRPTLVLHSQTGTGKRIDQRLESAKRCLARLEQIWPHTRPLDDDVPPNIDRFRILRELGRGGFGIVYLAFDGRLDRHVALKVLRPEALISPVLRARFMREAKAAARLDHPHIVGVYEVAEAGLRVWIASEYVAGDSLSAWLRRQSTAVSARAAATLVAQLADAAQFAHRQGVLHRDLKPSNVLLEPALPQANLDDELSRLTPKLIDFGLAKVDDVTRHVTHSGALIGTPPYMAPEQAAGRVREIGPATDVYGLGAILYELLTGRVVFQGESDVQTLRQVIDAEPVAPRRIRPDLSADLEAIVLCCLEKDPAKRYPTAEALAADLRCYLCDQPTLARPLGVAGRLLKWSRRRPALAGLVAVSAVAAAAIVALNLAYIVQLSLAREAANRSRNEALASASLAHEQEEAANRYLYASRMRNGYELARRDPARIAQLLEEYAPPSRLADMRGFEWYHLKHLLHAERLSLRQHRGEVYGLAFSPDGGELATGGRDGQIILWNAGNGQTAAVLAAHDDCVNSLAYSPDGRTLARCSCDHTVKLWRMPGLAPIATLEGHPRDVRAVAFSPDGQWLASGGAGPMVAVWDAATGKLAKTTVAGAEQANVDVLAWKDDHTLLFPSSQGPGNGDWLTIWDVATGQQQRVSQYRLSDGPRSMLVTPGGEDVLVGTTQGWLRSISELSTHIANLQGHRSSIYALSFLKDRNWLAVGYGDGMVEVRGWPESRFRQVLSAHTGRVQAISFSPTGNQLASASWDGTIKLWSLDFQSVPRIEFSLFRPLNAPIAQSLAFSDDFEHVAVPTAPDRVTLFSLDTGRAAAVLDVPGLVAPLSFSTTDPQLLHGYAADADSIWRWVGRLDATESPESARAQSVTSFGRSTDAEEFESVWFGETHGRLFDGRRNARSWSPQGARVINSRPYSPDRRTSAISVHAGPNHDRAELLDEQATGSPCFADHGVDAISNQATLYARSNEHGLSIHERPTGHEVCRLKPDGPTSVAFSPDNRTLATGDRYGRVQLWNLATGNLIVEFETDANFAVEVRFAPDGRRLAALATYVGEGHANGTMHRARLFIWSGLQDR